MRCLNFTNLYRLLSRLAFIALLTTGACIASGLAPTPALAIPSPELVVGTLTSVSQIFTLLAAILGGGALAVGSRSKRIGASSRSAYSGWLGLGAFAAVGLSLVGNWYQHAHNRDQKQARLEATLLRPSSVPGMPRLDPTLREPSYAQQLKHKQGISTADTAKAVEAIEREELKETVIVDVRESAETTMGSLPGAIAARYPDFNDLKLELAGKNVIVFCHNGSRSHEICERLAARGIDCRFLVGGLEKWVTEGRTMTGMASRSLDTLRAVPAYPAQRILLDTPEAHRLVLDQGAVFVDARTPAEFKAGHLPNAINLPIGRMPRAEVQTQIAALPQKPLILPCYDRWSCFFAEVLGYELDKAGRDVRGRFTVPWEYFPPAPRAAHVEQWLEASQVGLWEDSVRATAGIFTAMTAMIGLLGTIFIAALFSRLAVLPFSVKAERDQVAATRIAPEIDELKQKLASDPIRLSRAIGSIYRRNGLTPVRNLIAIFFVPVLALFSLAIQRVADAMAARLLWLNNLGQPDPYFVLPVLAAVLFGLYLHAIFVTSRRHAIIVWGAAVPLLAVSLALLGAAVNIYILISATLLIVQRLTVAASTASAKPNRLIPMIRRRLAGLPGLVGLNEVDQLEGCGNKAYRLARLKAAGVNVPEGVVLTGQLLQDWNSKPPAQRERILRKAWAAVAAGKVAVRSSSAAEDGEQHSFAGVFESVLEVDRTSFPAAVERVLQSFDSARAKSYVSDGGLANILIQRMVPAEYSGVMFTRDPAVATMILVEMVDGTADGLVSGTRTPAAFRFGRMTRTAAGQLEQTPPIDLAPLLDLGLQSEVMFGHPQDVEWAYSGGRFSILQSRDIVVSTNPSDDDLVHAEWARVSGMLEGRDPSQVALVQNEVTELLPRPTPLSLSLMQSIWASGGSLDLACSRLGLSYPVDETSSPYLVDVFGHTYVDKREHAARTLKMSWIVNRRLSKAAALVERAYRQDFLPAFMADMRTAEVTDFDRLASADLLAELERRRSSFIERTHVEIDVVNVLAQLFVNEARALLEAEGLDAVTLLAPQQMTEVQSLLKSAREKEGRERLAILRNGMGHRALFEYELARTRYGETDKELEQLPQQLGTEAGHDVIAPKPHAVPKALTEAVERARRFQIFKEDAKHHALRELAVLRRIVLAVGRRYDLKGLEFHLTFPELAQLVSGDRDRLCQTGELRRRKAACFSSLPALLFELSPAAVETAANGATATVEKPGQLAGIRVSGAKTVVGRARFISAAAAEAGAPIDDFKPGDIIVSRMISPAWLPYFRDAGGLVCEIGGWLSHTAVMAREYQVMMITGVRGLGHITDESEIELAANGVITIVRTGYRAAAE